MQQAPAPAADPNAQRWAEYYERDPATALQNGYTKAHYDAYLASKGPTSRAPPPPRAPAPVAPQASQVSANDEAWARLYEADPAKASGSGYTKAHYDAYLQKKGGAAPVSAPAPAAPQASQASENDEKWARYYEADPAKASGSGYTKAHYDAYLQKKNGGQ